ncbi:TPA: helix-turn-helix domain-containing protein [Pseudomonas aeruginosa]|uniref:helix-turn-helix domain-containing protein n=1 Tax=Pseudomonas aeruginosa TaxID=287 RepID=UPI0003BACB4D|nr:transcriptional regulator [Pseudomonas aeruginosa]EJN1504480.1 transcriptional regulator [Pseudomonas aeruginosa]EKY1868417.1 transcriptional regulator [Pseudomonas aeruginosa]ELE9764438.1 transcriptional regulator [Pseudomonas aeruginosa]ELE9770903.1 transcriptional regulator [Pseudomonas aeruginosa]ELK4810430.1 transcriptional regulator [Pseudomonas aeruginosa]
MYQYFGCGLEGIFLKNGYAVVETPHGEAVRIEDVEGLHRAIALDIIRQPYPMSGHQFRFLRKEQELTQAECAAILRLDVQTIANWEKRGKKEVPGPADFSMRMFYSAHAGIKNGEMAFKVGAQPVEARNIEREESDWVATLPEAA